MKAAIDAARNGEEGTVDITDGGEAAAPAADKKEKKPAKNAKTAGKGKKGKGDETEEVGDGLLKMDEGTLKFAVCTGNLASRKDSRDVKIQSFSISLFGKQLFEDQTLELTYGHRYGLVAQNGSGKSTLLKCIASRSVPIPDFVDIWFLDREAEPTDRTAMETVIDTVRNEKDRLEKLEEEIMTDVGPEDPRLEAIYEKLEKIDPSTFEKRAGE